MPPHYYCDPKALLALLNQCTIHFEVLAQQDDLITTCIDISFTERQRESEQTHSTPCLAPSLGSCLTPQWLIDYLKKTSSWISNASLPACLHFYLHHLPSLCLLHFLLCTFLGFLCITPILLMCSVKSKQRPYDCSIDFLSSTTSPWGKVYPLSLPETEAISSYIKENPDKAFICKSSSLASVGFCNEQRLTRCG